MNTLQHTSTWNIQGKRGLDNVRKAELEALIDAGATFPALPTDKVKEIGLPIVGEGEVAAGREKQGVTQRLTVKEKT